jgi:hypothetical protein
MRNGRRVIVADRFCTAETAWIVLLAGVTAWELLAPTGHLLSEGVDRAIERHPVITRAAIAVTALHLMNLLPSQVDPFHHLPRVLKI